MSNRNIKPSAEATANTWLYASSDPNARKPNYPNYRFNTEAWHPTPFTYVKTPDGIGVLIGVTCPANGLYFRPEITQYLIWYGTANNSKWVQREYELHELKPPVPEELRGLPSIKEFTR